MKFFKKINMINVMLRNLSVLGIASTLLFVLLIVPVTANAESLSADECYAQKDQSCLEEIFSDIVDNPGPEKSKAMYLLGLLQLEESKDYEAAKKTFLMSIMFGKTNNEKAHKRLVEIYKSGEGNFDPSDCLVIEEDACFERIIKGDDPKDSRAAQYLLGIRLYKTEPQRSFELLQAALEAGHQTATCEVQKFYADDGDDGVSKDYNKFVTYGLDCLFSPPFKKFNKQHFSRYESKKGHKAYVHIETGYANYSQGITSPELAASVAMEYCKIFSNRKPSDPPCKIINIDGTWVEAPTVGELSGSASGIKDIVSADALESYEATYRSEANPKVFVQSKIGVWHWSSKRDTGLSLEELQESSLSRCNGNSTVVKTGHVCKVININGEWVD